MRDHSKITETQGIGSLPRVRGPTRVPLKGSKGPMPMTLFPDDLNFLELINHAREQD